jgi:hypothetical protein
MPAGIIYRDLKPCRIAFWPMVQTEVAHVLTWLRGDDVRAIANLVDWDAQIQLFRSHLAGSHR